MKKILLATTMLAMTAGYASAEVAISGSARMGVTGNGDDLAFSSRVRIQFDATGTTDGGLSFGASMRADQFGGNSKSTTATIDGGPGVDGIPGNADDPADTVVAIDYGTSGTTNGDSTVFVSGSFGKLTMGDVAGGAADNLVGQISGVGYTGLGDTNEIGFLGGAATAARYDYTTGNLSVSLGIGQPTASDAKSIAVKYATDQYNVALGYSMAEDATQIDLKAGATFGAITGTARVAQFDDGVDATSEDLEWGVSVDYSVNPALKLTAFYTDHANTDTTAMGLGASYDLGGGASVVGGVISVDDGVDATEDVSFEAGVTMAF